MLAMFFKLVGEKKVNFSGGKETPTLGFIKLLGLIFW
jgi:hypothetical protein